jgi:hypothetical protein
MNKLAKLRAPMGCRQSALLSVVVLAFASGEVARFGQLVRFVAAVQAHMDALYMSACAYGLLPFVGHASLRANFAEARIHCTSLVLRIATTEAIFL